MHVGVPLRAAQACVNAELAAQKAGEMGHQAEVIVQGADNKFRTHWTYGADPYPIAS